NIGKGNCPHIDHQRPNEKPKEFTIRIKESGYEINEPIMKDELFIPEKGTTVTLEPYHLTEEEKANLKEIIVSYELETDIEGGYIPLKQPLWNDMDINYFAQMSNIPAKKIKAVLHGDGIVLNSDDARYPNGRVISLENAKDVPKGVELGFGVEGMNSFAKELYNWEATKDIYVLPYHLKIIKMREVKR
ncbi:MAG: hypothetical protein GX567_16990, partial [Clostridia bacterium]|nr:hypothetical protein [Clostridia bacterium]